MDIRYIMYIFILLGYFFSLPCEMLDPFLQRVFWIPQYQNLLKYAMNSESSVFFSTDPMNAVCAGKSQKVHFYAAP